MGRIDHENCSMCEKCLDEKGDFCPKNLFYKDKVEDRENKESERIRFKFKEITKCQGCLKCIVQCPEEAIISVKFEV